MKKRILTATFRLNQIVNYCTDNVDIQLQNQLMLLLPLCTNV